MKKLFGLVSVAALALPIAAHAATQTGIWNGQSWTAESRIVGVTSTATAAGGGNPLYFAPASQSSGIVSIIINKASGSFICSGTLLSDRRSIATAAHCVTSGSNVVDTGSTFVYFNGNNTPDSITFTDPASTKIQVSEFFVNQAYTGEVIDQNDIAILRLENAAPVWAASFGLYTGNDLTGQDFTVSGYGRRSDTGGSVGANLGVGRLRQGDNRFDFRLGDGDFAGGFSFLSSNGAVIDYSYVSDFDNAKIANDTSCVVAQAIDPTLTSGKFCNLGRGAREVGVAGGDSGGPSFINGQLAAITSYGLSFGAGFGDVDNSLNSSFGEFSGYVPTFIHRKFISDAVNAVPESSTWSMMIAGFGMVGFAMRRRTKVRFATA